MIGYLFLIYITYDNFDISSGDNVPNCIDDIFFGALIFLEIE